MLNCNTGQVLFEKNAHTKFYPASITKVMTALLVAENCSLSETVTFSKAATTNLESGAVTISLTEGDQLTVEQSLYALMLKSANEVANGLAEHVSGSISGFTAKMNERARALGCLNTNFANSNGLNNTTHMTTPYDMALITRAAFENPTVAKVASTLSYKMPATKKGAAKTVTMGHKMLYSTDSRYYEGIIGGKTGYTSKAGNTLVTCAQRDGVRLVAVVMKSSQTHYADTKAMLDYGFARIGQQENQSSQSNPSASRPQGPGPEQTEPQSLEAEQTKPEQTGPQPAPVAETSAAGPGMAAAGWIKIGSRWNYIKENQEKAANEWLTVDGQQYWFDKDGIMATGWHSFDDDASYYFHPHGALAKNAWIKSGEEWYYLGQDGKMLKDTVTPDGYSLGKNGVWIQ